jgi:hypothetical protein
VQVAQLLRNGSCSDYRAKYSAKGTALPPPKYYSIFFGHQAFWKAFLMSVDFTPEATGNKDSESVTNRFHSQNIIKTKFNSMQY